MNKLCIIYNFAQQYREGIFRLLDKEYNCIWFFGENNTDIKGLDTSILKYVTILPTRHLNHTPLYFQKGIIKILWRKDVSTYLMLGELYCISTWFLLIFRKLFKPKKKVFLWSHGWYGKETLLRKIIKKIFFKLSDGVFLYGNYAKNLMIKEGFDANKLFVVHNSLMHSKQISIRKTLTKTDIYRKHFNNNNPNIIFIGRLTFVKHIEELIEAIAILKREGHDFNLTIVGDGEMRKQLEQSTIDKGLNKNIWFYGGCYNDYINAQLIYNAELCVSPGNVGLTAIHAMTFGCPVATHNDFPYQMPEFEAIKDGVTGTFFEYHNVNSMTKAILSWHIKHLNDRESVRNACYKEIDTYWTPEWQIKVFKKAIGN